jgi:hypothetical protein
MYSLSRPAHKRWKMRNRFSRRSLAAAARLHVHVDAVGPDGATAVYTLADPRDVRSPRYVGQTRDPHARFAQHVRTARLWLPDDERMDARGRATQARAGMPEVEQRREQLPARAGMPEVEQRREQLPGAVADTPWWVRSPKHRPLYAWIRALHSDGGRLPFMWVEEWVGPDADALVAERAAIMRWLARGAELLNAEARALGAQRPLF